MTNYSTKSAMEQFLLVLQRWEEQKFDNKGVVLTHEELGVTSNSVKSVDIETKKKNATAIMALFDPRSLRVWITLNPKQASFWVSVNCGDTSSKIPDHYPDSVKKEISEQWNSYVPFLI